MPTIGFDLDMTLVDSRPGIHAALVAYRAETGVAVDADAIITRLGPPIQTELLPLVGSDALAEHVALFRRHMASVGVTNASALPGALEALAAVTAAGLTTLVVTAKHRPLAARTLATAGLDPDLVAGDVWSRAKAGPLREYGALAYVGDHIGDIAAAREAGITSVAVATGPIDADGLAGADVVLPDLTAFPAWLTRWLAGTAAGSA